MTAEDNKNEFNGFIPEQIKFQLDLISKSSGFKSSLQMQNFLGYIVRKKLAGNEAFLKQYTIAVEALGQPEDFDAETNPLIRIEAGRLRKKLADYYEEEGEHDRCIISIPVGRYVPKFEKNTTAKVPAETNRGDKSADGDTDTGTTNVDLDMPNEWKQSCGPRLLVSCFTDQTQGEESYKFLYHITDNLANVLSRFLLIRLISAIPHADKKSSNSVIASYRDNDEVDYILTAYIHHIDKGEYQLVSQLIEAQTQQILWSDSYPLYTDQVEKQQEKVCQNISAAVVDLMQGVIHVHWARKLLQNDWDSIDDRYKVLAFYRYYSANLSNESFEIAVKACQDAIERDEEDVIAHIIFSEYCRQEYVYGRGVITDPLEKGLKSGQQAIRLKPESHEAHYVLGQIWFHLRNYKLSMLAFEQSRRLSHHNPQTTFGYAFHLFFIERWDDAMSLVDEVMSAKAFWPDWYHTLPFLNHYRLGEYEDALLHAHQIVSPGVFWGPLARAAAYGQLDEKNLAKNECDELISRYPDFKKQGKKMLERYLSSQLLSNIIGEGLEKAGIQFES